MLVFVIPLRNPETAQDWERCNDLCQQTVRSALNQIDGNVRVIVVCKEFLPNVEDDRLTIIRHPFATPDASWHQQHRDKYLKIAHGMVEARKYAPCYIMKLDADDLLDRHLSEVVHETRRKPGYYISRGYRWSEGSKFVRSVDNFHLQCGSSNIIWCERDELPCSPDDNMSAFPIMRFGHNITVAEYKNFGTPLTPLLSRFAIYRGGHGENLTAHVTKSDIVHNKPNWKFYVGQFLRLAELRPLTATMRRDFFGYDT
jgi:hypothetical protein